MREPRYRIHPAIGIARVGNAPADDYFLGAELVYQPRGVAVDGGPVPPPYKKGGMVRRQAARFRIFEYLPQGRSGPYQVSREIVAGKDAEIEWTVHLANKKASFFEFDGLAGSPVLPRQPRVRTRRNDAVSDRHSLEFDFGARTISGAGKTGFTIEHHGPGAAPPISYLGELRTDPAGRLIAIGGAGAVAGSGPIASYANTDGYFDDVSDGPVSARIRLNRGHWLDASPAWLLVGPPDFGPALYPAVTLWDLLFDLAARGIPLPHDEAAYEPGGELASLAAIRRDLAGGKTALRTYLPSFDEDVAPILRQAIHARWAFEPAKASHVLLGGPTPDAQMWKLLSDPAADRSVRTAVEGRIREQVSTDLRGRNMPKMLGDDPYDDWKTKRPGLALTITQHAILESWAAGKFVASALPPSSLLSPTAATKITPVGLDRASMQRASGGAFFPGIEVGWEIREAAIFLEPFRINPRARSAYRGDKRGSPVGPGYFSRQMALPWLADFLQCSSEPQRVTGELWAWWPSQRPHEVYGTPADAAKQGPMVPWDRAANGGSTAWPADSGPPPSRDPTTPSYHQMLKNWWKFGFVYEDTTGQIWDQERASAIP